MLITDPWFYAVAIPAVLLIGLAKSGVGMGFGSLAVPLMALSVSVPQAAAILLPVLMLMDVMGLAAFRRHYDAALLKFLIPCSMVGIAVGTLLFKLLAAHTVAGVVGVLTLLFLAHRLLKDRFSKRDHTQPQYAPRWLGGLLTATSGFTSFIAHAGGPPIQAYVLPMRLEPIKYTATMAVLFFCINLAKWGPYAYLGLLSTQNMATSVLLLVVAPVGFFAGLKMAQHLNTTWFYRIAYSGMLATGLKLCWDGFRGF